MQISLQSKFANEGGNMITQFFIPRLLPCDWLLKPAIHLIHWLLNQTDWILSCQTEGSYDKDGGSYTSIFVFLHWKIPFMLIAPAKNAMEKL